jgi:hypothetical protein
MEKVEMSNEHVMNEGERTQGAREYRFDFNNNDVLEIGTALVTLLAFSEPTDTEEQRAEVHASLCAWALRLKWSNLDAPEARALQPIKPLYAFRPESQIKKDLRTLHRRLRDRMVAAHMSMAFLKEVTTGDLPKLPEGVKHLSVNELSAFVLDDAQQSDPENVETRIWRPSLPVLHIAAAVAIAIDRAERANMPAVNLFSLLMDPQIIQWVISVSQEIEGLFEKSEHLKVHSDKLIRLRLV